MKRIFKDAGYDPGPKRGEETWDEFMIQHAVSLWQCDLFSKRIVTWKGIRDVYVLAFLHVQTRQVVLSPATLQPSHAWVATQSEAFVTEARDRGLPVAIVQRDRDRKFGKSFDRTLRRRHVQPKLNSFRAPNTNAYVERFVQTIQQECLDRFLVFGEKHMNHICREFLRTTTKSGRIRRWRMNLWFGSRNAADRRLGAKTKLFRCRRFVVGSGWADCLGATAGLPN